ncbi:hypothetical protein GCM10007939_19460 [Amylibacter marinus]|uniref:SPW repeat-containing protein n=1 Tax=Amylibacter marinus TaxID=1475483 RepID=A0ABQ5VW53_9RHOB|nr:hypothetical protein [Amylibacter marinus]GLQ35663.1 hypothetical protein GCM10007939_19460 [Amylibacter marinus]
MLPYVLRANAASCALFGALFVIVGQASADFIGSPPVWMLQVLGGGLLINAAALTWTSTQAQPHRFSVLAFALGDLIWVLATAVILAGGFWITTPGGITWAVCVAVFVGVCGALQWMLAPR